VYIVDRYSNSKTNTKSYESLIGDFIFEATFKVDEDSIDLGNESCVLTREGSMGIFVFNYNDEYFIKWKWLEVNDEDEDVVNEIMVYTEIGANIYNKVKVIKKEDEFIMYVNDIFYTKQKIKYKLYNHKDKYIYVGSGNPYCSNKNYRWFYGNISDVKIYHSSEETFENMFLWFDFKKNTSFKTYDKSGSGNHGLIFESENVRSEKSIEFNKVARPAKIV
jgi:hypothetical protein